MVQLKLVTYINTELVKVSLIQSEVPRGERS